MTRPSRVPGAAWSERDQTEKLVTWRTIESAPRDGTRVLGYGPHKWRGCYIDEIHVFKGRWTIEWMDGYGAPTHWMPLPEPPR